MPTPRCIKLKNQSKIRQIKFQIRFVLKLTITSHIPSCLNGKNRSLSSKTLPSVKYDVDNQTRISTKAVKTKNYVYFFWLNEPKFYVNLRVSFKGAILSNSTWFHVKLWEYDGISTGTSSYKSQRKLLAGASHFFLGHFQDSLICFDMGETMLKFWGII